MDAGGNIHEFERARLHMLEHELAELIEIPPEDLERVQAMSIEDRVRWYQEQRDRAAGMQPAPALFEPVSKENIAALLPPIGEWPRWRKTSITSAIRIAGPFTVATSEGPLRCEDGWAAVDARGYPYPIADDEFRQIYAPAAAPDDVTEVGAARMTLVELLDASNEGVRLEAARLLLTV